MCYVQTLSFTECIRLSLIILEQGAKALFRRDSIYIWTSGNSIVCMFFFFISATVSVFLPSFLRNLQTKLPTVIDQQQSFYHLSLIQEGSFYRQMLPLVW